MDKCGKGIELNKETKICKENKNICTLASSEIKLEAGNLKSSKLGIYSKNYVEEF